MKEIILIVFICGLFIFFIWSVAKSNRKTKKEDKKPEEKPESNKKEEIPEILKEVTMGNYMHDISQNDVIDGVELEENELLEKPELKIDQKTKIEKAFDDIIDIDSEYNDIIDEFEEVDEESEDFLSELDDELGNLDDENEIMQNKEKNHKKSLAEEYKGLSKEMKVMLIANILEKKNK